MTELLRLKSTGVPAQHPPLCAATVQDENIVWVIQSGLAFLCIQQVVHLLWGDVASLYTSYFWKSRNQELLWLAHCLQEEDIQRIKYACHCPKDGES